MCLKFYLITQIIIILISRSEQASILIFGGNGFIGSECTSALLSKGHNITLVSRGSAIYDFESRIKPFVHHIKCDRYQGLHTCTDLLTNSNKYDVLLDFSAYYPVVIQDAIENLRHMFDIYIYISTDSVYEVSIPSKHKFSKETDAIRYENIHDQNQANERDSYGHYKLEGEELLYEENQKTGLQYIIFRLPDVFGPRDTTSRWWTYQAWFEYYGSERQSMPLPREMERLSTSYVYTIDIGRLIAKVITEAANGRRDFMNEAYNLAFPESITLRKLLHSIQEAVGVQGIEYNYVEKPFFLYPSVTRGPVDTTKVKTLLNWEVTPWMQAVKDTVSFYKEAVCLFPKERNEMLEKLQYLIPAFDFPKVKLKLEKQVAKCALKHTEL